MNACQSSSGCNHRTGCHLVFVFRYARITACRHCVFSSVSTPLRGHVRIRPVGVFSLHLPLPDAAPRREDKRAKEGPCLTAPGNDSLQMLCRVTSANHNHPLKPPENVIQRTGPRPFFSAHIMRPRDKHLHRGGGKKRLLEVQLCFNADELIRCHFSAKHLYYDY